MADRFPIIIESSEQQIQELSAGDGLDLTKSGVVNANYVHSAGVNAGVVTATSFIGDGSQITNIPAGGGSLEATASGTLANGDTTIVNTDGTVSAVAANQIGWIVTLGDTDNRSGLDYFTASAVDSSGNVYLVGYSTTEEIYGNREALISKYNSSGVQQWQRLLGDSNPNYAYEVVLDSSGDVYVSGIGDSNDGLIFKYNSSGTLQWQKDIPYMQNAFIAMDSSNNIYVAGTYYTGGVSNNNRNWLIMKLNNSGSLTWAREMTASSTDLVTGIAVDSSGNVFVSGYNFSNQAGIVKYNTSGTFQWHRKLDGTSWEYSGGVAVDSSGNSYVLYHSGSSGSNDTSNGNMVIAKYNSSGTVVWQRTIGDGLYQEFGFNSNSIAIDSSNNIYIFVATNSPEAAGDRDYLIAKYNDSGSIQWQRLLGGADRENSYGISVDNSGYIYITGDTESTDAVSNSRTDGFAAKLPDDGTGTGTYGVFTYVESNLTESAGGLTDSAGWLSDGSSSVSISNSSMTSTAGTIPSTTTSISSTNLTSENYIGISDGAYTNGQTATIQIAGSVDDAQSSLTPGQQYYVQNDGTLSTSAGSPSVLAGTAIATTKLAIG